LSDGRQIWVFGNPDKTELGFPDRIDLERYISNGIFETEQGRYRYTSSKNADVIVVSRDGLAFGHFDILEKVKPTDSDRKEYPRVQFVYLVEKSTLYEKPILLSELPIKLGQWGKRISEQQFAELQSLGGKVTEFFAGAKLPSSTLELERVLREVKRRLGQSDFRAALIEAYAGKCSVTACDAVDALEAAHIEPHCNVESNDPRNGLLLRADIHTLFDRQLLGINPCTMKVTIAAKLHGTSYDYLDGESLRVPNDVALRPQTAALEKRWEQFNGKGE